MSNARYWTVCFAIILAVFSEGSSGQSSGSPDLVISQVYGGGGNVGAPYNADFIELYNRGSAPVSLNGLSVQYATATGTAAFGSLGLTRLPDVTLAPGNHFLVREAAGPNGISLPQPFYASGAPIAVAPNGGKVALVRGVTPLGCNGGSTPCSAAQLALIIDLVGYGDANFFEGTGTALGASDTTAVIRDGSGAIDTDDNRADFSSGPPVPRNTGNLIAISIDDVTVTEGDATNAIATFTISLNSPALVPVTFTVATAEGTAAAGFDYVAQPAEIRTIGIGARSTTFDVTILSDLVVEPDETFSVVLSNVTGVAIADDRGTGTIKNDDLPEAVADLTTTIDVPAVVTSGSAFTYRASVSNSGPDAAQSVEVTNTLPLHASYDSVLAPAGWTCTAMSGELHCAAASLSAGDTATFTVSMTADCSASDGTAYGSTTTAFSPTERSSATANNASQDAGQISNPAPVISQAAVDTPSLWPPNGELHIVRVTYGVSDNCGPVRSRLGVRNSEAAGEPGPDGEPDWIVVDVNTVMLRAERTGTAVDGRVYTITITAEDSAGNTTSKDVIVTVPHNQ